MEKSRILSVMVAAILVMCLRQNAMAQDQHGVSPFVKLTVPQGVQESHMAPGKTASLQASVLRRMNRSRQEIARLRAAGKTDSDIDATLRTRFTVAGTGSIAGTIYESDGVTPISTYASVWAYDEFGRYGGFGVAYFSGNGVYQITGLSAGDYYLQISSVSPYVNAYYDGASDWQNATLVHVTDGVQTDGINFVLLQFRGAITGTVSLAGGMPLAECSVSAYDLNDNLLTSAQSDSSGAYIIGGLRTGGYKLQALSYGDANTVAQWFDRAESFDKALEVRVTEPETTKVTNFLLQPGGGIGGTVVGEGGDSIPSGECEIVVRTVEGAEIGSTMNTAGGTFIITHMPPGKYVLAYYPPTSLNYLDGWYDGSADGPHATPIEVLASETTQVAITLRRGGALAGTITAPGLPQGITLLAYNEQQQQTGTALSDVNGDFLINRLPAGRYTVLASALRSNVVLYPANTADQWFGNAVDFLHATFVDVTPPDTTTNINFTLVQGGMIVGGVSTPGGIPLSSGASVYVCDELGRQIGTGRQVFNGTYSIAGLPTGQYKLFCSYSGTDNYASEWYNGKASSQNATIIDVSAPGIVPNVNFSLEQSATVGGFVSDGSGTRMTDSDHQIQMLLYTEAGEFVSSRYTSFVGGFQGTALPGNYKLEALNNQFNYAGLQDSLGAAYYDHGRSFADSGAKSVVLSAATPLRLHDCVMERTTGGIAGTVYDRGTGAPMTSGAYILVAFDEQGHPVAEATYASSNAPIKGAYHLKGLWPGTYRLLMVAVPVNANTYHAQWYDGLDMRSDSVMNVPMPFVPPNARTVTVGGGVTPSIDFHIGVSTDVAADLSGQRPARYVLEQNYPNPFNPSTTIRYGIPQRSRVILTVYNTLGQQVAVLQNGEQEAGEHEVAFNGGGLASGVYFYRMSAASGVQTRKLILLK